jgi:hypothetical protein
MSKSRSGRRFGYFGALSLLATVAMAACGSSKGSGTESSATNGAGGVGNTTGSGTSHATGTGGDIGFTTAVTGASSSTGIDIDAGCAGAATKAQQLPLDMYIMLDQSASMLETVAGGGDKWDAITAALKSFLVQPGLKGISIGLQFFAVPPSAMPSCPMSCANDAACGNYGPCSGGVCYPCGTTGMVADSCDAADYATPDVEIAPLNGAQINSLYTSIDGHMPYSDTPTSAALQGAANPGHVVIAVLATDGDPTECDPSKAHINAIAAAGVSGTPKILTFVVGVGTSLSSLNGIAAAGGTTKAFIVDTNQNVNMQFLAALNTIRGAALGCQYEIPKPDGGKVNVQYTPGGGGASEEISNYPDKAHCPATGDGWYYDDPMAPTQILLCPATCTKVGGDSMGEVDVVLGCKTKQPA